MGWQRQPAGRRRRCWWSCAVSRQWGHGPQALARKGGLAGAQPIFPIGILDMHHRHLVVDHLIDLRLVVGPHVEHHGAKGFQQGSRPGSRSHKRNPNLLHQGKDCLCNDITPVQTRDSLRLSTSARSLTVDPRQLPPSGWTHPARSAAQCRRSQGGSGRAGGGALARPTRGVGRHHLGARSERAELCLQRYRWMVWDGPLQAYLEESGITIDERINLLNTLITDAPPELDPVGDGSERLADGAITSYSPTGAATWSIRPGSLFRPEPEQLRPPSGWPAGWLDPPVAGSGVGPGVGDRMCAAAN